MDEIEFLFIGWCHENSHDKVWTGFKVGDSYYCGWGKRDAKLQFKKHTERSLTAKIREKQKHYKVVDQFMLFAVFPYFKDSVSRDLLVNILKF